jgi:anaerobic selenocysteine-containing dehydrogenase
VIDPRASETAKIANIHIALRPGTDALLMKAMIRHPSGGVGNREYIDKNLTGFKQIESFFKFWPPPALELCEVAYDDVMRCVKELRSAAGVSIPISVR